MDDRLLPPEYANRYSTATSRIPRLGSSPRTPRPPKISVIPEVTGAAMSPEPKPAEGDENEGIFPYAWYDPRGWSMRKKLLVALGLAIFITVVIVGPYYGVKLSRYPDYTRLDYRLVDSYEGTSFFEQFNYFSGEDPTNGFVVYVNEQAAQDLNLTYATDKSAVLRVDSFTPKAVGGRNSVRIESKNTYDTGLFVFDIIHTPYGCGTWPALWLTDGYNWPNNGEIDVLETTNEGSHGNEVTLHTTKGCNMDVKRKETGSPVYKSCDNTTNSNSGCGVMGDESTYGEAMNNNGGGVYALELREAGIRAWFFPRNSIPDDITNSSAVPDPSTWGTALADFPSTECNIPSHFRNQSIIANIDMCGELAAQPQYYDQMYKCPGTCSDFVANNPSAFEEAYWEFAGFQVYQAI
ncbi:hypothetical protein N7532_007724 [Penicillium argentinense]|uniref:endo-1,3(4)-beta-glucanase n=1 Tax=Penicillium argentinense TaxID=1131581 RepID=A0A9W9K170_9EURO|nr:uncharacterized protein N7532_007724 [Penicillium argentinense]KAJ5089040.1 hypothetical protein N7532_007724 [Penicillium argentinense]